MLFFIAQLTTLACIEFYTNEFDPENKKSCYSIVNSNIVNSKTRINLNNLQARKANLKYCYKICYLDVGIRYGDFYKFPLYICSSTCVKTDERKRIAINQSNQIHGSKSKCSQILLA